MKDLLTLTQWLSPAFPVGAFAFSHGIETAVREERISNAAELADWVSDLVERGSVRSDVVLLSAAYGAAAVAEVDAVALAFQAAAERVAEGRKLGAAFARTVRDVWGLEVPDLIYPVAVGHAARLRDLPLEDTATLYAHAFVANMVSAAIRLVPLGQTEGQAVLAALAGRCEALGRDAPALTLGDLCNAAFLSDIAAMRHETLTPRIFQS